MFFTRLINFYARANLILLILSGIILGILVGLFAGPFVDTTKILGSLFVGALKGIAPVLVFILILTAISAKNIETGSGQIKKVLILYLISTFSASCCAVFASFTFPTFLDTLQGIEKVASSSSPKSISEVFGGLLFSMVENPVKAISSGNYLGILTWSIAAGFALRAASPAAKEIFSDVNEGTIKIVRFIVRLAPFGIFGLVSDSVHQTGISSLYSYLHLLAVLLGTMFFVALIVNALIVYFVTRKNPYPLIWICLKHSAIFAFFTRSSAANIPVNMALAGRLNIDKELYSVSIPLGATINMAGAAVTIAVLSLAAVHTLNIPVTFTQAILLCILSTLAACGASGVAGGSLLLIPLACSLFGIGEDISLQVVAIGFIIGVLQDSVETALNSSTDVLLSAVCSQNELNLKGL